MDGSHEYKDVAFEYNYIKQRQKKGDLILFDDVTEKYKGIIELVDEIKVSSQYNVRIISLQNTELTLLLKDCLSLN